MNEESSFQIIANLTADTLSTLLYISLSGLPLHESDRLAPLFFLIVPNYFFQLAFYIPL